MRRQRGWQASGLVALALAFSSVATATDSLAPGIQLFESRRYEEARKFFEPLAVKNPKDPEAAYYLGRTLFYLQRFEPAAQWLEKATNLAPSRSVYYLWLGRAFGQSAMEANVLRQAGLAKKTKAAWEKAIALDANNLDARADLIQYFLRAPGILGGSVEKAREQAAEIQKRDAVRGAQAFANIHLHEKDPAAAVRVLEEAIRNAPAEPRLRFSLASLYQSQQQWDQAFAALEALLKQDPDHWDALYQVGRTAALSGKRADRGEECLKRYLGHTPGPDGAPLANAHFRLGMVYEKKGNKALAKAEYQTALKLDPKLKDAKEALEKLD